MAEVWVGTDEVLARRVAIKLLHRHLARDASFIERFRAEAVAAARLAHPNIVSIYDTFEDDGLQGIVMELVVGTTVRADLDQHGPLRLDAVLAIGTQVADALGAAHQAGLVHRDVKPANILLSKDGRVLVTDFGIAKAAETGDLTATGAMIGTAKYLAPEQVEGGPIDGRADLYALGVVLYEALTGTPPFVAETDAATALARLHRDPRPPSELRADLPRGVEAVVLQCLARDPDHRFATAAALRRALVQAGAEPERAPAVAAHAAAEAAPVAPPSSPTPSPTPPPAAAPPADRRPDLAPSPVGPGLPAAPAPSPLPHASASEPGAALAASRSDHPDAPPAPRRRRGRTLALLVLLGAVGVVAASLLIDGSTAAGPVAVASVRSFDPQGDNGVENEELTPNAIDGDPSTAWRSERYTDPVALAGKDGVGLVLALDGTRSLDALEVTTAEAGWSARVYVADAGDRPTLEDWGEPVSSVAEVDASTVRFALDGARGREVLLWFTRLPATGAVEVSDVTVTAR
jgi:serine/threonine-protein kinase